MTCFATEFADTLSSIIIFISVPVPVVALTLVLIISCIIAFKLKSKHRGQPAATAAGDKGLNYKVCDNEYIPDKKAQGAGMTSDGSGRINEMDNMAPSIKEHMTPNAGHVYISSLPAGDVNGGGADISDAHVHGVDGSGQTNDIAPTSRDHMVPDAGYVCVSSLPGGQTNDMDNIAPTSREHMVPDAGYVYVSSLPAGDLNSGGGADVHGAGMTDKSGQTNDVERIAPSSKEHHVSSFPLLSGMNTCGTEIGDPDIRGAGITIDGSGWTIEMDTMTPNSREHMMQNAGHVCISSLPAGDVNSSAAEIGDTDIHGAGIGESDRTTQMDSIAPSSKEHMMPNAGHVYIFSLPAVSSNGSGWTSEMDTMAPSSREHVMPSAGHMYNSSLRAGDVNSGSADTDVRGADTTINVSGRTDEMDAMVPAASTS